MLSGNFWVNRNFCISSDHLAIFLFYIPILHTPHTHNNLSKLTLPEVNCRKKTRCPEVRERWKDPTVIWHFASLLTMVSQRPIVIHSDVINAILRFLQVSQFFCYIQKLVRKEGKKESAIWSHSPKPLRV